jgi:hypothetical protein
MLSRGTLSVTADGHACKTPGGSVRLPHFLPVSLAQRFGLFAPRWWLSGEFGSTLSVWTRPR